MEDSFENPLFDNLKKKKKKSKTAEVSEEGAEPLAEQVEDLQLDDMFAGKKKKKKKAATSAGATNEEAQTPNEDEQSNEKKDESGEADYTYEELVARVFKIIREQNPELAGDKKKYTIVPPQVNREGTKKTAFSNLIDICKRMRRQPDHVIQYLFTELGTSGSIDGSQRLIIKGRFQQKQIENLLKKYIVEYVTCKTCKSAETQLTRENRLYFVQCESCGSTRTVSAIKTGFVAQTQKRAAQRAAAG